MIKIVIVENYSLVRAGFRRILELDKNFQVVGEAGTGAQGIKLVQKAHPDIVILDFKLPDISGLEVTNEILASKALTKIVIVSAFSHDLFLFRILEAGAHGYLTKNANEEEFIRAIKTVYSGQRFISQEIAQKLALDRLSPNQYSNFSSLSDREAEVMLMVINRVPVKEIANKLNLSPKTVHSYRGRIFEKLNVKNNTALTLLAIKHGIVTIEEI